MILKDGMWLLVLNDMRASNIENATVVCCADTKEELEDFLEIERVCQYSDGTWGKAYRKGGPLEWYNPPFPDLRQGIFCWRAPPPPEVPSLKDIRGEEHDERAAEATGSL